MPRECVTQADKPYRFAILTSSLRATRTSTKRPVKQYRRVTATQGRGRAQNSTCHSNGAPIKMGSDTAQCYKNRSEARSFRQVDPEPVTAALVFAGHFCRRMTELLLHVALIDLGR